MRLAVTFIALLLPVAAAAQVYSWKDASGKIHYSDRPPAEDLKNSRKLGPAFTPTEEIDNARKAAADKRLDAAKTAKESQEAAGKAAKLAADNEQRARDCERARTAMQGLESGQVRYRMSASGEREALDDAAREAEMATVRRAAETACSPAPAPQTAAATKK